MRFLMVHRIDESAPDAYDPSPELYAGMGRLMGEMTKAGVLLAADGALHSSKGARIRYSGGKRTVTDGPFTESKEVIGGFDVADDLGEVEVEVRQLDDQPAVG